MYFLERDWTPYKVYTTHNSLNMTIKNRNPLNLVELLVEKQNKTTERQLFAFVTWRPFICVRRLFMHP